MEVYGGAYLPLTGGTLTGNLTLPAAGSLIYSARSQIQSPSDGVLELLNNAGTDFLRLLFGGATSLFPGLTKVGPAISFRRADNTIGVFADLPAAASTNEGAIYAISDSTTATWRATITGGGTNHVLAYSNGTAWTVAA